VIRPPQAHNSSAHPISSSFAQSSHFYLAGRASGQASPPPGGALVISITHELAGRSSSNRIDLSAAAIQFSCALAPLQNCSGEGCAEWLCRVALLELKTFELQGRRQAPGTCGNRADPVTL